MIFERRSNNVMCKASNDLRWCSHDDDNGTMLDSSAMRSMLAYRLEDISIRSYIPPLNTQPWDGRDVRTIYCYGCGYSFHTEWWRSGDGNSRPVGVTQQICSWNVIGTGVFREWLEPYKNSSLLNPDIQKVNMTLCSHSIVLPKKWHICKHLASMEVQETEGRSDRWYYRIQKSARSIRKWEHPRRIQSDTKFVGSVPTFDSWCPNWYDSSDHHYNAPGDSHGPWKVVLRDISLCDLFWTPCPDAELRTMGVFAQ